MVDHRDGRPSLSTLDAINLLRLSALAGLLTPGAAGLSLPAALLTPGAASLFTPGRLIDSRSGRLFHSQPIIDSLRIPHLEVLPPLPLKEGLPVALLSADS